MGLHAETSLFPSPEPRTFSPRPGFFFGFRKSEKKEIPRAGRLNLLRGVFRLRKVFETIQAEKLQKTLGGAVEDGTSRHFGSAGDADQMLLHQAANGFATGH